MPRHIPRTGNPRSSVRSTSSELEGIAARLGRRQVLRRLLAVVAGLDVPAAAERDLGARIEGIVEVAAFMRGKTKGTPPASASGRWKPTPP